MSIGLFSVVAPRAGAVIPTPPAPACTTKVVPGLPLIVLPPNKPRADKAMVNLTATDSHGLWAGVRYDGAGTFQVVGWRNGVMRVLDSFSYTNWSGPAAVTVVGISNAGAIVINAEDPTNPARNLMYRYQNGFRYDYGRNGSWLYPFATAMSLDGHVAGYVRTTTSSYLIAEWDAAGRATTIVSGDVSDPTIDKYDDMIWSQYLPNEPGLVRFRTPAGRTGQLNPFTNPDYGSLIANGRWVWSRPTNSGNSKVAEWDMAAAANGSLTPPVQFRDQSFQIPVVASPNRALLASDLNRRLYALYDAYGDGHRLNSDGTTLQASFALAADGTLAYVGSDGLTRFVYCPLNYAKHNPRGVIYHGAMVGGQTLITGGSFDSDDAAGHDLVYVFDQTTSTRRLLATVTADQYDPSFSQAYGISGNHRYRYAFPAAPGKHTYCAYGRNVGYGNQNTLLGCTTVTA